MTELGRGTLVVVPKLEQNAGKGVSDSLGKEMGAGGKNVGSAMGSSMLSSLKKFAAPIAAVMTTKAVSSFAKSSVSAFTGLASQTKSLQRVMGGTAKEVSSISGAMRLAGMDTSKAGTSLTIFSKKITAAKSGTSSAVEAFKSVGVSLQDSTGKAKDTSTLLGEVSDKFAAMPDGAEKTALAVQLFGRSGTAMLPFLNKGSASIEELKKKADELGIVLDDGAMDKFSAYKGAVREWQTALEGAQVTLGGTLLPFVTAATGALTTTFVPAIQSAAQFASDFFGGLSSSIDVSGFTDAFGQIQQALGSVFGGADGGFDPSQLGSTIANAVNQIVPILQGAAPIVQQVAEAFNFLCNNAQVVVPIIGGVAVAFAAVQACSLVAGIVSSISGALSVMGGTAPVAAGGIQAVGTAIGEAGTKAAAGVGSFVQMGVAVLAIGAGVALAAAGMWVLAQAAVTIATGGSGAAAAMLGMVGAIAALAAGAAVLGPALTAGSVGMLAFGAAVTLVGVGILAASAGMALVAAAMPVIAAYGTTAGIGLTMLGTAAVAAAPGMVVFAGALTGAVVPLGTFAALGAGVAAEMVAIGTGAAMAASGTTTLLANLPQLPDASNNAANALQTLTDKMTSVSGQMQTASGAIASALNPIIASTASLASSAAGMSALAMSAKACQSAFTGIAAGAKAATTSVRGIASAPKVAQAGFTSFATVANSAMVRAKNSVTTNMKAIAKAVSGTKLKMSKIDVGALPHFSFSGKFDAKSKSVPKLNVSWYAKGGAFDSAQVIGIGEAGTEYALRPSHLREIANLMTTEQGGGGGTTLNVTMNVSTDGFDADDFVRELSYVLNRHNMTAGGIA